MRSEGYSTWFACLCNPHREEGKRRREREREREQTSLTYVESSLVWIRLLAVPVLPVALLNAAVGLVEKRQINHRLDEVRAPRVGFAEKTIELTCVSV